MRKLLDRATTLAVASVLACGFLIATAIPAAACDCVGPQPMAAYAGDAERAVFTGVVQVPDGRGVHVRVTRWFQGPDRDAIVWLDGGGFGVDGASCRTALPPAGTEWIFVADRTDAGGLAVNLCTPHAAASDAAGRAMFADAIATFGQGLVPGAGTIPSAGATEEPAPPMTAPAPLLIGLVVAVVAAMSGLAVLLSRRRNAGAGRS